MERGRPSEYKEEYVAKVDEYLNQTKDSQYENGIDVNLPTKEDFATFIGVSKRSLYHWSEKNPDFLHALEKIENEQKKRLINSGLSNKYNSQITKLILSSNHGMKERSDHTTDDKPINKIQVEYKDYGNEDNTE